MALESILCVFSRLSVIMTSGSRTGIPFSNSPTHSLSFKPKKYVGLGGDFKSYDLIFVGDFQFLTRYDVGFYGGQDKISKNYFFLVIFGF